jgi:hypothetical protein
MTNKPLLNFKEIISLFLPKKINKSKILDVWRKKGDEALFLSKSSWSLALISQLKKQEKDNSSVSIWIPSFFCNESLSILRLTKAKLVFYPISESLEPNYDLFNELKEKNGKPDIFLLVHFFGKPIETVRTLEFCRSNNTWLIEDAVHCLAPSKKIGNSGDFILYSPHKLLPIPDGSVLVARLKGPSKIPKEIIEKVFNKLEWKKLLINNNIKRDNFFWFFKQILMIIGLRRYIKYPFNPVESVTHNLTKPEISNISLRLLNVLHKKFHSIALKRKYNYLFWENHFTKLGINSSFNNIESIGFENFNWTPYLYTIENNNDLISTLYNDLNPKNYLPSTWPDLPPEVLKQSEFYNIATKKRNTMLHIPLHHSIKNSFFRKLKHPEENTIDIKSEWNKISKTRWNELMNKSLNTNLLQLWSYGEAKFKSENWTINRVTYSFNGKVVAYVQILEKNFLKILKIYRINRGPIFLTKDKKLIYSVIKSIMSLSNILRGIFISASFELKITPSNISFINSFSPKLLGSKGYTSIWIDLKDSMEELRTKFDSKWRNMLVKSEKQEIDIKSSSSNDFAYWLSEIHHNNMNEKSFNGLSKKMLQSISDQKDLNNPLVVYKALKDNIVIGSICIINHGKYATYLIGWTNYDGRKLNANYLLLWEAIKDLKLEKKLGFDLGGIDYELTPNISSFKSKMNGKNYNLVPSLWK